MQAIILAAGMGKRLKELTEDCTKCMVKVNGVAMIERMLSQLDKLNLSSIVIVVGYKDRELIDFISTLPVHTPIVYVRNEIFYKTNNIYSLYLARNCLLEEDTLLLESDLIFDDSVLSKIVDDPYPSLVLAAKYESWMDGTVVTLDEENNIKSFLGKSDFDFADIQSYYKTVNIYKFSQGFSTTHYVPFLEAYCQALGDNEYYEQVLKVIALLDKPEIKAAVLDDEAWYEIDDAADLDIAESIFAPKEDKLVRFQRRYGGYWRYNRLVDFCYLGNPFYPPAKLQNEIKASFECLLSGYPSGIETNNLLATKYFGLLKEQVCVGNGAAELIKSLMERVTGSIGMIYPTFEEYPNRKTAENIVAFYADNNDFKYSANDLMTFYNDKEITALVLINPDNPTGNYIEKEDVLRIAKWAEGRGIKLIVDESFVDFADTDERGSLLEQKILKANPNLIVIKSISKSFGVPGLRLGIIAAADVDLINYLKKDVAIWNINSFAEFFLQIFEKYKSDYEAAMKKLIKVRKEFIKSLNDLNNLRVVPTQANFIMCEVTGPLSATQLTQKLLVEHNILIKDLSPKKGFNERQFIRLAVKKSEENYKLILALQKV